jgi:hypothetical protein
MNGSMRGSWAGIVSLVAAGAILALAGCSRAVLSSGWPTREVVLNGVPGDWPAEWFSIADDRLVVSVTNDAEYLYLAVAPGDDSMQAQIMRRGLTLWFDPAGGKAKSFGLRYPIGMPRPEGARPPEAGERSRDMRKQFESTLGELEILGLAGSAPRRLTIADAPGIKAAAALTEEKLVCEFRIPLAKGEGRPDAIGAVPGGTIAIGFAVPALGGRGMPRGGEGGRGRGGDRPGGPPPGGGGGEGGERMGPPGGMRWPVGFTRPKALDFRLQVTLANR